VGWRIVVNEAHRRRERQHGVRNYTPSEGKLLVFGNGNIGVMQSHGIHAFLEASNRDLVVTAAKSLAPRTG
jgi:hypothetical protein